MPAWIISRALRVRTELPSACQLEVSIVFPTGPASVWGCWQRRQTARRASTICACPPSHILGFPFLLFEKRYYNSAGARMGSDHTSYSRVTNFFQVSFPDVTAVFDIF